MTMTPDVTARFDALEKRMKNLEKSVAANMKLIMAEVRALNVQLGQLLQQQQDSKVGG